MAEYIAENRAQASDIIDKFYKENVAERCHPVTKETLLYQFESFGRMEIHVKDKTLIITKTDA